jgi:hypothetical protein
MDSSSFHKNPARPGWLKPEPAPQPWSADKRPDPRDSTPPHADRFADEPPAAHHALAERIHQDCDAALSGGDRLFAGAVLALAAIGFIALVIHLGNLLLS